MLGLTPLPFCPCSARELEQARLQLQDEVRQLGSQLLEERKRRETHEALARRLQKRVLLLTKVRASPGPTPSTLPGQQTPSPRVLSPSPAAPSRPPRPRSVVSPGLRWPRVYHTRALPAPSSVSLCWSG